MQLDPEDLVTHVCVFNAAMKRKRTPLQRAALARVDAWPDKYTALICDLWHAGRGTHWGSF